MKFVMVKFGKSSYLLAQSCLFHSEEVKKNRGFEWSITLRASLKDSSVVRLSERALCEQKALWVFLYTNKISVNGVHPWGEAKVHISFLIK